MIKNSSRGIGHAVLADVGGAVLIEFAVVLPLLLILVFGIIDFGRAFWTLNTARYAAEQAGRYAMLYYRGPPFGPSASPCTETGANLTLPRCLVDYGQTQFPGITSCSFLPPVINVATSPVTATITVQCSFSFVIPKLLQLVNARAVDLSPLTLTGTSVVPLI